MTWGNKQKREDAPRVDTDALTRCVDLVEIARRAGVNMKAKGREFEACCPFHEERTPSFTIFRGSDGRQRFQCFGCNAKGDAITFVEKSQGVSVGEAIRILSGKNGPAPQIKRASQLSSPAPRDNIEQNYRKRQLALQWWHQGKENHPLLHAYFEARGIKVPPPRSLRLHPGLTHPEDEKVYPVMLAPIQNKDGGFMAVHRTYLRHDGSGKAPVKKTKLVLGPMAGGVIRLGPVSDRIVIAEGIETVLSPKHLMPDRSAWTFVSLGNLTNLELPLNVDDVLILADADTKADHAQDYHNAGIRLRHQKQGRKVRIAWPAPGMDFNDMAEKPSE